MRLWKRLTLSQAAHTQSSHSIIQIHEWTEELGRLPTSQSQASRKLGYKRSSCSSPSTSSAPFDPSFPATWYYAEGSSSAGEWPRKCWNVRIWREMLARQGSGIHRSLCVSHDHLPGAGSLLKSAGRYVASRQKKIIRKDSWPLEGWANKAIWLCIKKQGKLGLVLGVVMNGGAEKLHPSRLREWTQSWWHKRLSFGHIGYCGNCIASHMGCNVWL